MLTTEVKSMALTGNKSKQQPTGGGGGGGGTSVTFRTPQNFVQKKKIWNKNNRSKHNNHQPTHQDLENIQQNDKTSVKQQNKKAPVVAAKFYLSDKRPPKEIIVPPTKFLLGGNISDPLNLNSLQNETTSSNNNTPVTTPRRSPTTQQTPPKIDVIIPPNIHDPLHLLDPVDSMEYEKQLTSPMKRKTKSKRHRKKKPKRRRLDSTTQSEFSDVFSAVGSCSNVEEGGEELYEKTESENSFGSVGEKSFENSWEVDGGGGVGGEEPILLLSTANNADNVNVPTTSANATVENESLNNQVNSVGVSGGKTVNSAGVGDREKLRLDLGSCLLSPLIAGGAGAVAAASACELVVNCDQQHLVSPLVVNNSATIGSNGNNRKRKSSEGQQQPGKNKQFRRLDSMDKIVSPVVPQPGAWKRPPHFVPTGARKVTRNRTTSHSETDILSPVEESKSGILDDNSIRSDTPDAEVKSFHGDDNIKGSISPSSRGTTSAIAGSSIAAHEPILNLPKIRKDGYKFQYGNYDGYAGYRNLNETMDVRLQVFQQFPEIFKGKDVLDIGCNVGHMAIAIGRNFSPKSILGIDIDKDLVSRARKNLSMYVRIPGKIDPSNLQACMKKGNNKNKKTKKVQQHHNKFQKTLNVANHELFPISFPLCLGDIKSTSPKSDPFPSPHPTQANQNPFPKNVFFRHTNYVLKDEALLNNDTPLYDVIVCLSVTKWIHLNYGDSGLKLAFKRMFNQLRPGGKLILEAQNWASYKKKKNLTENIYTNYRTIEFFPDYFHEYLLSNEVGFSHSYTLGVPRHLNKGFCRPIQLYAKGDFTPNHIQWSDAHHPQTPYETYRGIYACLPRPMNYPNWGGSSGETPRGNSGSYSCRQTPLYAYNPLETDYLPSYGGIESLNRHYVFASPLYQTVWSPPASLKTPSNRTPHARSVREAEGEDIIHNRHVYPPSTDEMTSPVTGGAFNSIREADIEEGGGANRHVYATNCESPAASPRNIDCEDNITTGIGGVGGGGGSDVEANGGYSPYGEGYD